MAGELADLRNNIKAKLAGITYGMLQLMANKIFLGYVALSVSNRFLIDTVTLTYPVVCIRGGSLTSTPEGDVAVYDIPIDIWFAIAKDTDNDLIDIEELLAEIKNTFSDDMKWSFPEIDYGKSPAIVHYLLTMTVVSAC